MFLSDLKDSEAPRTMYRNLFCTSEIFAKKRDSPPGRPRSVPGCRGRVGGEGGRGQGEVVSLPPWAFFGVDGTREGGACEDSFAPGRIVIIVVYYCDVLEKKSFLPSYARRLLSSKVERERKEKEKEEETRPRNPPPPPPPRQARPAGLSCLPLTPTPLVPSPTRSLTPPHPPYPRRSQIADLVSQEKVLVKTVMMIMIMW